MVLAARLELRQRQALVITPQLQQAIKLLQLSSFDLQTYIEQEVQQNPLLSLGEVERGENAGENASDAITGPADLPVFDGRDAGAALDAAAIAERDASEHREDDPSAYAEAGDWKLEASYTASSSGRVDAADGFDIAAIASPEQSLKDHLRNQVALAISCPLDRFVALYLIDLIEPDGYLRADLAGIAEALGITRDAVERVLHVLQTCEPAGVCARNLAECLALQLRERNRLDPVMQTFLKHLDLLAARDFARLRKLCGVDDEDLEDMIREVRGLDPRPGLAYERASVAPLIPDVLVRRGRNGGWQVELNPDTMPTVNVDRAYYAALKSRLHGDRDRNYLAERMSAANWLAKSLEQRGITILKVATAIVEAQAPFLEKGVRYLKPLNLRQVAAKIGMHESTVSRVTSNKAIATPRGVFDMKYFFTSSIPSAGPSRQAHSSEAVRDRIRELIMNEPADQVLSDDRIVALLQSDGIDIARRTVAKYREALRIPSSAMRRRVKRSVNGMAMAR
jgi:RNA polymerase sigma-54 factor